MVMQNALTPLALLLANVRKALQETEKHAQVCSYFILSLTIYLLTVFLTAPMFIHTN